MEINLNDFGPTLVLGVFIILGLLAAYYTFGRGLILAQASAFFSDTGTVAKLLGALTLTIAALGLGIIGEDVSNKFADIDRDEFKGKLFNTQTGMRVAVLFDREKVPGDAKAFTGNHTGNPLCRDLAATGRLSRYLLDPRLRPAAIALEAAVIARQPYPSEDLGKITDAAYYPAKNIVYQKDAYRDELAAIQIRADFTRSIAIHAIFILILAVGMFVVQLMRVRVWTPGAKPPLRFPETESSPVIPDHAPPAPMQWLWYSFSREELLGRKRLALALMQRASIFFTVCLAIYYVGRFAFHREEREFNVRTFGYYATLDEKDLPTRGHPAPSQPPALSGAQRWDGSTVLVVHDAKSGIENSVPRLGLIDLRQPATGYTPLVWPPGEPIPSDLESVCAIPGHPDEFLVAESGYYKPDDAPAEEKPRDGRIFWVTLSRPAGGAPAVVTVLKTFQWPDVLSGQKDPRKPYTHDIEGIVCVMCGESTLLVAADRAGGLYWGPLDLKLKSGSKINLPGYLDVKAEFPSLQAFPRLVTELHVDAKRQLWAAAAFEPKETEAGTGGGPFRSAVYQLGTLNVNLANPIELAKANPRQVSIGGLKVEALTSTNESDRLFMGTDDESFGGLWRLIQHP